jgi:hypothetical protein
LTLVVAAPRWPPPSPAIAVLTGALAGAICSCETSSHLLGIEAVHSNPLETTPFATYDCQ